MRKNVRACSICCNVAVADPCPVCSDPARDRATVLVVEQAHDLEAFEAAGYRGMYHVLGGVLNPIDGVELEHLTLEKLLRRLDGGGVREVILGMDPDFEGDGTARFLAEARLLLRLASKPRVKA